MHSLALYVVNLADPRTCRESRAACSYKHPERTDSFAVPSQWLSARYRLPLLQEFRALTFQSRKQPNLRCLVNIMQAENDNCVVDSVADFSSILMSLWCRAL